MGVIGSYRAGHTTSFAAGRRFAGFTIMELLIVIVLIGIITSLTFVSFAAVTNSSKKREAGAEAAAVATQLKKVKADRGAYPANLDEIDKSSSFTHGYNRLSSNSFCVSATKNGYTFRVSSSNSDPTEGSCPGVLTDGYVCPSGYIAVPGDSRFSTSEFCAMKYEAKILGNNNGTQAYTSSMVPESRAMGTPWVNITQANAIAEAQTACSGCHLITEAEWMTIAANVLSVPSNWSGGAVGSGYIYSGHNDNVPANSLAASTNDTDGFSGTGQSGTSRQRRTLTLTNGEVIWDFSGNVWERVGGQLGAGGHPGVVGEEWGWKELNAAGIQWAGLGVEGRPSTISAQVSSWGSAQGMGMLLSQHGLTTFDSYLRGGHWGNHNAGLGSGVLALAIDTAPRIEAYIGFRVAR